MKQAASRPSPPLPSPASGSCSRGSTSVNPFSRAASLTTDDSMRLVMLFASERPIRNSIER